MSLLGFDKVISQLPSVERKFLTNGMRLSQEEFKINFDTESDSERGSIWDDVVRSKPPKILVRRGSLKDEVISGRNVVIMRNSAILTIDPTDANGRGYADYHQDGIGKNPQRRYITESPRLVNKHTDLLLSLLDKAFR